jgi:hypothetical protein
VIKWLSLGIVASVGLFGVGPAAALRAQTVVQEREATITGPRGRTIDRRLEVERGPGMYQRQLQIQRPGGTLQRNFLMERVARGGGFVGGGYGPRPMFFERNVFITPRPATSWSFGLFGAPILAFPFWQPAPPPPVVVAPPPGGVAPQPGVAAPGAVGQPSPAPLDPVALAAQRLQSHHASSRRDGAQTLGRLGDPRAVPALVHALKYDSSKDVKIAAATALGDIGGQDAEVVLERCIIYEKKQEVRDAAAVALRNLRDRRDAASSAPPSTQPMARFSPGGSGDQPSVPRLPSPSTPSTSRPSPFRSRPRTQEPPLDGPAADGADSSTAERIPPPPPSPVGPM